MNPAGRASLRVIVEKLGPRFVALKITQTLSWYCAVVIGVPSCVALHSL
ncbi:MAG: hypothetical protein Q8S06_10020 [Methanobacteriaceae archaeon]|nr:hypothetical protein [Methanobacteriaceae archaeon]